MVDVTFTSDPTGAILRVEGDSKGTTPVTVAVPKGKLISYRLNIIERGGDYDLNEACHGTLTATQDTAIGVWISRTTAEQRAAQREAAKAERARLMTGMHSAS